MNDKPFPLLQQIKDGILSQAFRFVWDQIQQLSTLIKDPNSGTLQPDTKPANATEGTKFFSTDFNRLYRFSSGVWVDDVTAPARFQIAFFFSTPEPSVGWVLCDGRSALRSTASGGVLFFETPSIPVLYGQTAWMRL